MNAVATRKSPMAPNVTLYQGLREQVRTGKPPLSRLLIHPTRAGCAEGVISPSLTDRLGGFPV